MIRALIIALMLTGTAAAQFPGVGVWRGPAFSGATLDTSGIQVWLDAIDSSTIIRDGSGYVSVWNDKGPYGRYYRQYSAANQPRFYPDSLNGRAGVRFDGANDLLVMQAKMLIGAPFTVYIIQRTTGDGIFLADSAQNLQIRLGDAGNNRLSTYDGTQRLSSTLGLARSAASVLVYKYEAGIMYFYQDTTGYGSGGHSGTFGLGHMGRAAAPFNTNYVNGPIGAVLVFGTAHSDSRRQQTVQYLKERWGL